MSRQLENEIRDLEKQLKEVEGKRREFHRKIKGGPASVGSGNIRATGRRDRAAFENESRPAKRRMLRQDGSFTDDQPLMTTVVVSRSATTESGDPSQTSVSTEETKSESQQPDTNEQDRDGERESDRGSDRFRGRDRDRDRDMGRDRNRDRGDRDRDRTDRTDRGDRDRDRDRTDRGDRGDRGDRFDRGERDRGRFERDRAGPQDRDTRDSRNNRESRDNEWMGHDNTRGRVVRTLVRRPPLADEITEPKKPEKKEEKDPALRKRHQRMFGALMGHLEKAKANVEEEKSSVVAKKKEEIDQRVTKRLEEDKLILTKQQQEITEAMIAEERKLRELVLRKRQLFERSRVEEQVRAKYKALSPFLFTAALPHLYYLPKSHNEATQKRLTECQELHEQKVQQILESMPLPGASEEKAPSRETSVDVASNQASSNQNDQEMKEAESSSQSVDAEKSSVSADSEHTSKRQDPTADSDDD
eukprot:TRINITY_DN3793_c0_g8_i1.p1 TRINITY_DN3793_c0_g8~~TRINITY_DN3793_c0_g8_i1.p1  ORF type:complete len:474 (-),score=96.37 TRINITY_DN3793_c0_g8_i1:158-1579(-)